MSFLYQCLYTFSLVSTFLISFFVFFLFLILFYFFTFSGLDRVLCTMTCMAIKGLHPRRRTCWSVYSFSVGVITVASSMERPCIACLHLALTWALFDLIKWSSKYIRSLLEYFSSDYIYSAITITSHLICKLMWLFKSWKSWSSLHGRVCSLYLLLALFR